MRNVLLLFIVNMYAICNDNIQDDITFN